MNSTLARSKCSSALYSSIGGDPRSSSRGQCLFLRPLCCFRADIASGSLPPCFAITNTNLTFSMATASTDASYSTEFIFLGDLLQFQLQWLNRGLSGATLTCLSIEAFIASAFARLTNAISRALTRARSCSLCQLHQRWLLAGLLIVLAGQAGPTIMALASSVVTISATVAVQWTSLRFLLLQRALLLSKLLTFCSESSSQKSCKGTLRLQQLGAILPAVACRALATPCKALPVATTVVETPYVLTAFAIETVVAKALSC